MTDTNAELLEAIKQLTAQIKTLDARVAKLEARQEIPESDLVAIAAAVAAFLGHKAKVRAVRFGSHARWAAASRGQMHNRTVPHFR